MRVREEARRVFMTSGERKGERERENWKSANLFGSEEKKEGSPFVDAASPNDPKNKGRQNSL